MRSTITILAMMAVGNIYAQKVGIGTATPNHRLQIVSDDSAILNLTNTQVLGINVSNNLVFRTGSYYTGAIRTIGTASALSRLALFTYASGQISGLKERLSILDDGKVGINTTTPAFMLDVEGRMRIKYFGATAGVYLGNSTNTNNPAFVGMLNDSTVGFYGSTAGWDLLMNTNTGNVGIGVVPSVPDGFGYSSKLLVKAPTSTAGTFQSTFAGGIGLVAYCDHELGTGVYCWGGHTGIQATATAAGDGVHKGVEAYGQQGTENNYGVFANGAEGKNAYGVYATAFGGSVSNWAGYFAGSVYSTGTYQGSDRKLKRDIRPLTGALSLVEKLEPSAYNYRTTEFRQMQLPEGEQFGLIADQVQAVIPGLVKTGLQPAVYENDDDRKGKKLGEAVEFSAVNYTALIPVLIAAIKEQQAIINSQQQRLNQLEALVKPGK